MNARFPIAVLAVCLASVAAATPPNIVFIIADDLSAPHIGPYGSEEVRTPNLDRLAREGVVFENAFVSTPSCTPSRAAILTGRDGFELGAGATLWGYLPAEYTTYPELLEQRGYRIGASGKGWAPGFLIDRAVNPAGTPHNDIRRPVVPAEVAEGFEIVAPTGIDYAANFEAFLAATPEDAPFAFWIGTFEPHRGYTVGLAAALGKDAAEVTVPPFLPDSAEVREDVNEYYAEVELIDAQVGRVLAALEARGRSGDTLLVFTSDNGMPFPRAKATLYDYGTRMPLILWGKGKAAEGRRVADLVSLTDIAPTFLDAAGVPAPAEMTGRSLMPLVGSAPPVRPHRPFAVYYRERHGFYPGSAGESYPSRAIRTRDHLLIWNADPDAVPSDVDGGPTKTFMHDRRADFPRLFELSFGKRPEFELYAVADDPYQMRNLAADGRFAPLLTELKAQLFGYLRSRGDPRMAGNSDAFRYAPYFGVVFQQGLLQWTPEQQGQDLDFAERRELLRQAFANLGEEAFFAEMLRRQDGKL